MDPDRAREVLQAERERVERALGGARRQEDDGSPGVVEHRDELSESLRQDFQAQLAAVQRAEARLAAGSYGRSIRSGQPIPDEQLEARPTAELTVEEERAESALVRWNVRDPVAEEDAEQGLSGRYHRFRSNFHPLYGRSPGELLELLLAIVLGAALFVVVAVVTLVLLPIRLLLWPVEKTRVARASWKKFEANKELVAFPLGVLATIFWLGVPVVILLYHPRWGPSPHNGRGARGAFVLAFLCLVCTPIVALAVGKILKDPFLGWVTGALLAVGAPLCLGLYAAGVL
jgi:DnaK suppressor protein